MAVRDLTLAQRKRLLGEPCRPQALSLLQAMKACPGVADRIQALQQEAEPLLRDGVCPEQLINGDDLIAQGQEPGPQFARLLDELYDAQLEGCITTREQALAYLRDLLDKP